jgi:hypothetical protein
VRLHHDDVAVMRAVRVRVEELVRLLWGRRLRRGVGDKAAEELPDREGAPFGDPLPQ